MNKQTLKYITSKIAVSGKGILAADESEKTIQKRFAAVGLISTEETRRAYREMLFTTPNLNSYISAVILFEETLTQKFSDKFFPEILLENEILPGVKVDNGFIPLVNFEGDFITQGLDELEQRLEKYKKQEAYFAKWRAVFSITEKNPNSFAIKINAQSLARYAAICQSLDIVPIVEPEVLIDGTHTIEKCAEVTRNVFHAVFHALHKQKVYLEGMILKPSMVLSGKDSPLKPTREEVAEHTLNVLLETVPAAVQTINFLSGGQTPEEATAHLNQINIIAKLSKPWNISFSYARALQQYALETWAGKKENVNKSQKELLERAKLNSLASIGKYDQVMEK